MFNFLDMIEIELYCLNSAITTLIDPVWIENKLNLSLFSPSYTQNKKGNNIIPESLA